MLSSVWCGGLHHHRTQILLDVICEVESALREGCPRTMTGVSQYWFSGHF
jgi:hypothetical protein